MGKIIVQDDVPDVMVAKVITEEVYRATRADYNLREVARVYDTGDKIHISVPIIDRRVSGEINVPELAESQITSQVYTQIDERLHKNVVHIAISEESKLTSSPDILTWNIKDAGEDIARMENLEISQAMAEWDAVAGSDWTDNANDPFADIMAGIALIGGNNFRARQIWMNMGVYAALVGNTNIVDRLERGVTADGIINSIAGLKIGIDNGLEAGVAYLADPNAPALFLADGPALVNQYKNNQAFFEGYNIADFLHIENVITDASLRLTGLLG